MTEFHGKLTYNEFLMDWFGYVAGRELGSGASGKELGLPPRQFVDDPNCIIPFVAQCREQTVPAFITVHPYRKYDKPFGIEKLFYDFDDKRKKPKPKDVKKEIKKFVEKLHPYIPLIVKTFRGYHVYVFLRNVVEFPNRNKKEEAFMKLVYGELQSKLMKFKCRFIDSTVIGDIKQLARIPISYHEKGVECVIVNNQLDETKVRGLDYFRLHGIRDQPIKEAINKIRIQQLMEASFPKIPKKKVVSNYSNYSKRTGILRPCFVERLVGGEMTHQMRLALLSEAYYAGETTEDKLVEVFRPLNDFDGDNPNGKCRYQVRWYLNKVAGRFPPYTCDTLMKKGLCVESKCGIYCHRTNNV